MTDDPQDTLDALLRDHLRNELDGHLGRAASHFERHLKKQRQRDLRDRTRRLAVWSLWAAGAMAASVGIVWGVATYQLPRLQQVSTTGPAPTLTSADQLIPIGRVAESQTSDEGTVVIADEGPARQLRREVRETTEFYDPQQNAHIEVTVPRQQVMLIGLHTY